MRVAPLGAFHAGNSRAAALAAIRSAEVTVLEHLVDSRISEGIRRAADLLGVSVAEATYELGNGSRVLAQDTVPFTFWASATYLHDYPSAILACIEAGGDVDTTAAITGGIVATFTGTGPGGIPPSWLNAREPLPAWAGS